MKFLEVISSFSSLIAIVSAVPASLPITKRAALDDFIAGQTSIAANGVLANIGSMGARSYGASKGLTLASPSKSDPDYFYTWTRDSALVFKALVDRFIDTGDTNLQLEINNYISAQANLQTVAGPTGGLSDGLGLGEPKFLPNGSAFYGLWGRPQRDGPALRATAMVAYGRWLLDNNYKSAATDIVWPIIKNDLAYVTQYWNQTAFDLWEETLGSSFFTTAVQYRALVEGSGFASSIGKSCDDCDSQAPQVLCFLQTFWNGEYVVSNINGEGEIKRSGKDAASILASLHVYDSDAGCDDATFQPCSPRALSNHKAVVDSFRGFYAINNGIANGSAVAVGRYTEDIYFNGNPWYLTTLAAAEQLYYALHQVDSAGSITITSVSLPFWRSLYPSAAPGTYKSNTGTYSSLANAMRTYADGFISIVQKYTPSSGALAEQFDKSTGAPLSAAHLTWSYASFLTAVAARDYVIPASWNAGTPKVPSTCSASPAKGSYAAATNTAWPDFPCNTATSVIVTFNVLASTSPNQNTYVVGSIPELGGWDAGKGVKLGADRYTQDSPLWYGSVTLDAGTRFEFKYVKTDASGGIVWEKGQGEGGTANRVYVVPKGCEASVALKDWFTS
ncbi:beta-glucosidase [Polyplosphaeria fusca]|uniref:Glucoamylase n=1 Tax=Polyplosphaeria fusca TaxID=682080 RepID=A0A9P4QWY9_9PLEO|nr:beta-glucosidase [Polyplosphaeria fusca]